MMRFALMAAVLVACDGASSLIVEGRILDAQGPVAGASVRGWVGYVDHDQAALTHDVVSDPDGYYRFEFEPEAVVESMFASTVPEAPATEQGTALVKRGEQDASGRYVLADLLLLEWEMRVERDAGQAVLRWETDVERPAHLAWSFDPSWRVSLDPSTSKQVLVLDERLLLVPRFDLQVALDDGIGDGNSQVYFSPWVVYELDAVADLAAGKSCRYWSRDGARPLEEDGVCPVTDRRASWWREPTPWVEIDLESSQTVTAVSALYLGPGGVDVEVSVDGSSFTDVGQLAAGADVLELAEPTLARFVRLVSSSGEITELAEVGVF